MKNDWLEEKVDSYFVNNIKQTNYQQKSAHGG